VQLDDAIDDVGGGGAHWVLVEAAAAVDEIHAARVVGCSFLSRGKASIGGGESTQARHGSVCFFFNVA
jgi:hypothetical protein